MYKCLECGHIFEDGEQAANKEYHDEIPGGFCERFASCPICGGEFEETHDCKKCGGAFLWGELFGGYYCEDCLRRSVTFENFLDFATTGVESSDEVDTLEDFMLREIFEVNGRDEVLTCSSWTFKTFLRNLYNEAVKTDKLHQRFSGEGELMGKIHNYLTDCELWENFAEYLYNKEVKK